MAHRYITDLRSGDRLDDAVFLIRSKDLRTTTQGSLYIHAVLVDKTGQLVARMWQASEEAFLKMPEGGFLRFKGRVESYKGNLQFIIDAIQDAKADSFDKGDFIAATSQDTGKMWARLKEILSEIKNPDLSALIQEFLEDEDLMARFKEAPAAAVKHHAYLGGLLEHTLHLLELGLRVIPLYPKLSLDLCIAGLFLHDIGKAAELSYDATINYTDQGQLLGHLVLATIWIDKKADAVAAKSNKPFPKDIQVMLQHIVLSHHGRYEYGSPKLPAIPEAAAIHYLDNLDAKVNMFLAEIESDADPAARWTNYNRALETKIFKPDVFDVRNT